MTDVDAAKLPVMLTTLRLSSIWIWQEFGGRVDREGSGSAHFLAAFCEYELAIRQAFRRVAYNSKRPAIKAATERTKNSG
jgi:hypothetical protein